MFSAACSSLWPSLLSRTMLVARAPLENARGSIIRYIEFPRKCFYKALTAACSPCCVLFVRLVRSCAWKKITAHFGISEAFIIYDQPPRQFRSPTAVERHALFQKLMKTVPDFSEAARAHKAALVLTEKTDDDGKGDIASNSELLTVASSDALPARRRIDPGETSADDSTEGSGTESEIEDEEAEAGDETTPFTTCSANGTYSMRKDRPALLVSSTSWTPDEDFSVLLDALTRLDSRATSGASPSLPFVVVVVTGKGPEKERYVKQMRASKMSRVALCTAWLEPDDYPLLLGSADLGISLHTSTSGKLRAMS